MVKDLHAAGFGNDDMGDEEWRAVRRNSKGIPAVAVCLRSAEWLYLDGAGGVASGEYEKATWGCSDLLCSVLQSGQKVV